MKIKIHDLTWEVRFTDYIENPTDSNEIVCGLTLKTKQVILISVRQSLEIIKRTITHELVHAYIWSYGFENSDPFSEEEMCNFIETHMRDLYNNTEKIYNKYLAQTTK